MVLATARVSPIDADRLGDFFEVLAADKETLRFFHPHPLTKEFASALCARQSSCLDRYFITHYRGRVVGYSMLRGWDEGFDIPSFGGCTHPQLRGAGLGQLLLTHAILESRRARAPRLRLTVYKENLRAIHIYRKFGFVFSDKSEHELIGLLDLDSSLLYESHTVDMERLDGWLKNTEDSVPKVHFGRRA